MLVWSLSLLSPHYKMYALATCFGVLSSVCAAMVPRLVTLWVGSGNFIHMALFLHCLSGIMASLRGGMFTFLADATFSRMGLTVLEKFPHLTMGAWESMDKAELTKTLMSHVGDVAYHTGLAVNILYRTAGSFVVLTVFLLPMSKLLYGCCILFAFVHVFTVWCSHKMYDKCLDKKRKIRTSFDTASKELVDHFASFRYYGLVDACVSNLGDSLKEIRKCGHTESYAYSRLMVVLSIVPKLLEMCFMAIVMKTGHVTRIWECVTYYHSASDIVNCVKDVMIALRERKEAMVATRKYMSMDVPPHKVEVVDFKPSDVIKFENVCFSYPTVPEKSVLTNFNLTIKFGDKIALVAKSGGGKTTVVKLIMGLYKTPGITLNGAPLPNMRVAIVPQEPVFFENKTIKENITLGLEVDDDVINERLRHVRLDGVDIHSKQAMLSGGQKQRLAIVRMLVRNVDFVVVDEPASALDSETEKDVMKVLHEFCKDKTVILITHNHGAIPRGYRKVHVR